MSESKSIEILKMALLLEHRGKSFYHKVADQTENEELKEIFQIMAAEEQLHIDYLSEQYAFYNKNQKFDPMKTSLSKVDDSIASKVLSAEIKERLSSAGFEAAAISAAIDMEKKAIEVYKNRALSATDESEKKLYESLANWENDHLNILSELNKELTEKIWYDNNFWPF